jgi:hypothetical protein
MFLGIEQPAFGIEGLALYKTGDEYGHEYEADRQGQHQRQGAFKFGVGLHGGDTGLVLLVVHQFGEHGEGPVLAGHDLLHQHVAGPVPLAIGDVRRHFPLGGRDLRGQRLLQVQHPLFHRAQG